MSPVEAYYQKLDPERRQLAYILRDIVLAASPQVTEKLAWGLPFFYAHSYLCYLNPDKKGGLYLGFTRGNQLSNQQGILEMKGRKQIASISYRSVEDIDVAPLEEILQEALLVDEEFNKKK